MVLEPTGLRIVYPKTGEPAFLSDLTVGGRRLPSAPEDGEVHAIISRLPGPNGAGVVQSFSSNLNTGTLAAVQWVTDPVLVRTLLDQLRDRSGNIPRYYQVALKVVFRGGVPTNTSFLLQREVQPTAYTPKPRQP
jgi:hypothetical protein